MRIGIDATCWSNRRGFGRFTRELLKAIADLRTDDQYVLFVDRQTAAKSVFPSGWEVVVAQTTVAPSEAAASDGRRSVRDMWVMRRAVQSHPVDVIFFPAVYSYFPVGGRVPCLVTFHDVIAETLPHLVFESRRSRFFWSIKSGMAVRRSNCMVTVSEASKLGLIKRFGLDDSRVRTITEAPSEEFRPVDTTASAHAEALQRHGVTPGDRFLLSVGGISPHKNLDKLIEAFAELAVEGPFEDLRLVFVGDYQGDVFRTCYEELIGRARQANVADRVHFAGYVPDDDLAHLYAACQAFVFPSYLEGFGLPAVEAMACGAPVVASTGGSLPEVLGGAGELFDPHCVAELVDRLRAVLEQPQHRQRLHEKSLERAKDFTWERAARQTVTLFHEFGAKSA